MTWKQKERGPPASITKGICNPLKYYNVCWISIFQSELQSLSSVWRWVLIVSQGQRLLWNRDALRCPTTKAHWVRFRSKGILKYRPAAHCLQHRWMVMAQIQQTNEGLTQSQSVQKILVNVNIMGCSRCAGTTFSNDVNPLVSGQ